MSILRTANPCPANQLSILPLCSSPHLWCRIDIWLCHVTHPDGPGSDSDTAPPTLPYTTPDLWPPAVLPRKPPRWRWGGLGLRGRDNPRRSSVGGGEVSVFGIQSQSRGWLRSMNREWAGHERLDPPPSPSHSPTVSLFSVLQCQTDGSVLKHLSKVGRASLNRLINKQKDVRYSVNTCLWVEMHSFFAYTHYDSGSLSVCRLAQSPSLQRSYMLSIVAPI